MGLVERNPSARRGALLLVRPAAAYYLSKKGWGSHLLTPESIRKIRTLGGHSGTGSIIPSCLILVKSYVSMQTPPAVFATAVKLADAP